MRPVNIYLSIAIHKILKNPSKKNKYICNKSRLSFVLYDMRKRFSTYIVLVFTILLSACNKIDYSDHESEVAIFSKPIKEVERLATEGNVDAKFRLALEEMPYSQDKAIAKIKSLYYDSKHLLSGYYIANRCSNPDEKSKLLLEIANSGNSYTSVLAKCNILKDDLKSSLHSKDKEKFDKAYSELLSYAKMEFQPAAVMLIFFIKTNLDEVENLKDVSKDILSLYEILSKNSQTHAKYYALCHAETLIKLGRWNEAIPILQPIANDFMKRENFTMAQSMARTISGNFYAEAKATALMACAYENGLGVRKDEALEKKYRDKTIQLQNEWFFKSFTRAFEMSYGDKNSFVFDSPKDAKIYRDAAIESENSKMRRLRDYNSEIAKKIETASKMPIECLKNASDEIGKVEYAKKLLGLKSINIDKYTLGKYNKEKSKEAISILEELADNGNQYANLTLAELYMNGNSRSGIFYILNMPVDFAPEKARKYASKAIGIGTENAWTARAFKLLGDADLLKIGGRKYMPLDGFTVKTNAIDSALNNYSTAAKLGDTSALIRLHHIYANGIATGFGKYLVEANQLAAFSYAKDSLDLGDLSLANYVIYNLYEGKFSKTNVSLAKKYIKKVLSIPGSQEENGNIYELAAILAENNQLEGYAPKDAEKIRNTIPYRWKHIILNEYKSGRFKSKNGEEYWNAAEQPKKEPRYVNTEFSDYFKSLPKTKENRFLYGLSTCEFKFYNEMQIHPEAESGFKELEALAKEEYIDAVKVLAGNMIFPGINEPYKHNFRAIAKKLNLPISSFDNQKYNMARYEETKDDEFLYMVLYGTSLAWEESLEFLSKHAKNNYNALPWAALRLLKADADESPQEFEDVVKFIKECAKDPFYTSEANMLLAYAYSGNPKMKNDQKLSSHYIQLANNASKGEHHNEYNFNYDFVDNKALIRLNTFLLSANKTEKLDNLYYARQNSLNDLRALHKKNPKNASIKMALAEKEKEAGNHSKAFKLYKELNESNPDELNYSTPLAELYYYGLGVKADKKLALEYYRKLFSALKKTDLGISINAECIFENSLQLYATNMDYCKVKIPKEVIIENIRDIPVSSIRQLMGSRILSYLRKNGEVKLHDELEKKFIYEGNQEVMMYAARRLIDMNTPDGDKKAFELLSKLHEKQNIPAILELGSMYFLGRGTKQDYKKAFEIFKSRATDITHINTASCIWVSLMYKMGLGTEKSEDMSKKYIDLACQSRYFEYNFNSFANQLIYGNGYHYDFRNAPRCPELGVELLKRSIFTKKPNCDSFLTYAILLEEGKYVKRDLKQAAEYYEKFARTRRANPNMENEDIWGFSEAIRVLKNTGDESDRKKAFELASEWIKAEPNSVNAKIDMALLKMHGIGTEKNLDEAISYLNKAVNSTLKKKGYIWRAYGILAYCYMEGIGVEKSPQKVREIIATIRKTKTSRCGVWYPFLTYAEWFNPNREITDTDVVDDPILPKNKEMTKFWLGEFERVADTAKNPKFSVKAYERLIKFFSEEKGFKDPQKVENLKGKLVKAKERVSAKNKTTK